MKKKVLLSSIATIALCLCLIAGSTFALFTDSSKLDIEVTAGDVAIDADISNLALWSVTPDEAGDVVDENGGRYRYENQTEKSKDTFLNTGKATFDGNVLNIERITPGDKVTFNIECANTSNVSILMRYVIRLGDNAKNELAAGMVFNAGGINYTGVVSYTSVWVPVAVGDNMVPVPVELGLPVNAGNEYQATGVNYIVTVEAVQGNAAISYDAPIVEVANAISDQNELEAAIADPFLETIVFDTAFTGVVDAAAAKDGVIANKTFWAGENDVALTFKGALENVVVRGINDADGATRSVDVGSATGDITILDCSIKDASGSPYGAVYVGTGIDVTVENCEFIGVGKSYGVYGGTGKNVTIKNCVFKDFGSWVIMPNGTMLGSLTIDGCTFENCSDGIAKAGIGGGGFSGTVEGTFTFTNNTLINCTGHDRVESKMFTINSGSNVIVSGNIRDGVAYQPGSADGIN